MLLYTEKTGLKVKVYNGTDKGAAHVSKVIATSGAYTRGVQQFMGKNLRRKDRQEAVQLIRKELIGS